MLVTLKVRITMQNTNLKTTHSREVDGLFSVEKLVSVIPISDDPKAPLTLVQFLGQPPVDCMETYESVTEKLSKAGLLYA